MKATPKLLIIILISVLGHYSLIGQNKDEGRVHIGLNAIDALLQNVHTNTTFRVGKHFNIYADLGYCLFRKYRYQTNLSARVNGYYGGFGLQWRFRDENQKSEVYCGLGLLLGMLWHDVKAKIPNYYGEIEDHWTMISSYGGYQFNVGYGILKGRFRIDGGLRLSIANSGYGERYFHSYMPAMGRVNMFTRRLNYRSTTAITPSLTLSYRL